MRKYRLNMTQQEIYSIVRKHLLEQGQRSVKPGTECCLYRSPNGLRCAVGALIPNKEYRKSLENFSAYRLRNEINAQKQPYLYDLFSRHAFFLQKLQAIHDQLPGEHDSDRTFLGTKDAPVVELWKHRLDKLAEEYNLEAK